MSAEIRTTSGVSPELIGGGGGIFDVYVDGKLIFSKFEVHRFPETGALLKTGET